MQILVVLHDNHISSRKNRPWSIIRILFLEYLEHTRPLHIFNGTFKERPIHLHSECRKWKGILKGNPLFYALNSLTFSKKTKILMHDLCTLLFILQIVYFALHRYLQLLGCRFKMIYQEAIAIRDHNIGSIFKYVSKYINCCLVGVTVMDIPCLCHIAYHLWSDQAKWVGTR